VLLRLAKHGKERVEIIGDRCLRVGQQAACSFAASVSGPSVIMFF
jgi:hypothetical protein